MLEKLHIKITIFAALVTTIYCIIFLDSFTQSCLSIIITIGVFYTISGFITMNLKSYKEMLKNKKLEEMNESQYDIEKDTINEENNESNHNELNEFENFEEYFEDISISN